MNRRGTEPYARWCGRSAGAIPPPTRLQEVSRLDEIVLAVDPGRDKAGMAVVSNAHGTLYRCVVSADDCASRGRELAAAHGGSAPPPPMSRHRPTVRG